ncbi:MAG: hypothetical protein KAI25_05525 [Hyphomicrobiaceae bacterium]|nr:hypothetical protein [Hyphomicrobiaceae bacterium]
MSFDWTTRDIRTLNLLEGPEFDRQYNEYKGVVNGGFDHMNLPSQAGQLTDTHIADQAMMRVFVNSDFRSGQPNPQLFMNESYADVITSGGVNYEGLTGEKYQGQWVDNAENMTFDVQEGMLQLFFSAWFWTNLFTAYAGGYTWAQFRLQVDGNTVAQTGKIYRGRGNVHLCASVPVPQLIGSRLSVGWRAVAPQRGGSNALPMVWWDGGSLMAINRYR